MAFERDFVERFGEDGRGELITHHKGLKEAHLKMAASVSASTQTPKHGDERFTNHFKLLAQREEHNIMCLISPPDRADYEMVSVPSKVAAMIFGGYAAYNAYRCDCLRHVGDKNVIDHLDKVTHYLEELAKAASESEGKVLLPVVLINQAYDSALAEVDPNRYQREIVFAAGH